MSISVEMDRINLCLFSLAVADAGYLLAISAYKCFSILFLISHELGDFWKIRSLNTVIGVFWGFSSTSNLHTMIVALDRCLCVVSPFRAKHILKTKVTAISIIIIYVCIMGSSGIFNVKFDVGSRVNPATNETMYIAVLSRFYIEQKVFVDLVYNYILAIAVPFTSLVVVIISTSVTVVKLRMALAWKQESQNVTGADLKEAAVTRMLLVVCYVYVICVTPSVVNAFLVQFIDGWIPTGRFKNTFYVRRSDRLYNEEEQLV
nr:hypothetical protein BaRGS_020460 [Batillaria attramentaria]